jgi:hypothetical protein
MTNPTTSPPGIVLRPAADLPIDQAGVGTYRNNPALNGVDADAVDAISDPAYATCGCAG